MNSKLSAVKTLTLLVLLSPPLAWGENGANPVQYQAFPFELTQVEDRIVPVDLNGDGLRDLLTAEKALLSIYFQKPLNATNTQAFNFSKADLQLTLPGQSVGWDLDWNSLAGNASSIRIVAVVDGKQVLGWPIVDNAIGKKQILLQGLSGHLPLGAYPLNFVRDINDDQRSRT